MQHTNNGKHHAHGYRKRYLAHNGDVLQALIGIENDTQLYGNATYQ